MKRLSWQENPLNTSKLNNMYVDLRRMGWSAIVNLTEPIIDQYEDRVVNQEDVFINFFESSYNNIDTAARDNKDDLQRFYQRDDYCNRELFKKFASRFGKDFVNQLVKIMIEQAIRLNDNNEGFNWE